MSENSSASASRSHAESSVNPVERKAQHSQLGFGQVRQADRRHLVKAKTLRGQHQSPAGDNAPVGVDQDRQNEAEPFEARRELAHLLGRVLTGLPAQRLTARRPERAGASNHAKGDSRSRHADDPSQYPAVTSPKFNAGRSKLPSPPLKANQ